MIRKIAIPLCVLTMLCWSSHLAAGPIQSELKSYRCLVPDFLVSSGGTSPALSPDGTTLVFITQQPGDYENDAVWVLSDADRQLNGASSGAATQPWKLAIKEQVQHQIGDPGIRMGEYRNVDWSPDGQKVVFTCHGRLYMAELADLKAKNTDCRKLCDIISNNDRAEDPPIAAPRWSPDGSRIAFLWLGTGSTPTCKVYVLDVATGEKKIVAQDAMLTALIWEQPWSPDGRSLAYSSIPPPVASKDSYNVTFGGISVASAGGRGAARIIDQRTVWSPSWAPKGNRIAYVGPAKDQGLGSMTTSIYVCDMNGRNRTPVSPVVYSPKAIEAARTRVRTDLVRLLREDYPGVFSQTQLKALSKLHVTEAEAIDAIGLAQVRLGAELEGGEFLWRAKAAMKQLGPDMKNLQAAAKVAKRATRDLPEEKRTDISQAISKRVNEVAKSLFSLQTTVDKSPVWSPDGRRIAFIRADVMDGTAKLMVADLATKKARAVFDSGSVGTVSWTKDGKLLLLQAKRGLARTPGPDASVTEVLESAWMNSVTTSSYPEIWLIELRQQGAQKPVTVKAKPSIGR